MPNEWLVRIDRWTRVALVFLIGCGALLAVASLFAISLSEDESAVLLGLRSVLEPVTPHLSFQTNLTNGGLFAFMNLAVEWLFGSQVWIHKLVSLSCLLVVVAGVYRIAIRDGQSSVAGWIALAPLLGLPGTIEVSTLALGHTTAFMLFFLACRLWTNAGPLQLSQAIIVGVLTGLAAGSRLEFMLVIPVFVVFEAIKRDESGKVQLFSSWPSVVTMVILSVVVVVATSWLLVWIIPKGMETGVLDTLSVSTGSNSSLISSLFSYPKRLNYLLIGEGFMPLFVAIVATGIPFVIRSEKASETAFEALLLASGWILCAGWFVRSPLPHLRYLWPALACFAIPAGLSLARLYAFQGNNSAAAIRRLLLLTVVAMIGGGFATTTRSVILGDGDLLMLEWSRLMPIELSRGLQSNRNQAMVMDYVRKQIPADATVISYGFSYKLRYLAHRPVFSMDEIVNDPKLAEELRDHKDVYVTLCPLVGNFIYLFPEVDQWFIENAKLDAQFGRYSVYKLPRGLPEDVTFLRTLFASYVRHPLSRPYFKSLEPYMNLNVPSK